MRADIFLMHPMTLVSFKPEMLPRVRASQALALPEVQAAVPVYLAQAPGGTRRAAPAARCSWSASTSRRG